MLAPTVLIDARCLQDAGFAGAEVAGLTSALLSPSRAYLAEAFGNGSAQLVAVVDDHLPPLRDKHRALFDRVRVTPLSGREDSHGIFVQPSPMSRDQGRFAPLLARSSVLAGAIVHDSVDLDQRGRSLDDPGARVSYLANLLWLRHYHVYFPVSQYAARRLREMTTVDERRVVVMEAGVLDVARGRHFWERIIREYHALHSPPARSHRPAKPVIAFLTPFPPQRSGVADYTARSLESLREFAIVDVFTDADSTAQDRSIRRRLPISDFPYALGRYDRIVSVAGNSHYHIRILELLQRYGGACIQHDNRLVELYWLWKGPIEFTRMASRALGRPVSIEEGARWITSPHLAASLFFDDLVRIADPLIVHSRGIQRYAERQYGIRPEYLPFCVYRHFGQGELEPQAREEARRRLGIAPGKVVIASFGYVHPLKAPLECVRAVEHLRSWGIDADLYFVGPFEGQVGETIRELARQIGVEEFVHTAEQWVDDETYRSFLAGADFGIQLRTHGFGGLSGALMDCISAGLRTVANEDLAAAMDGPAYIMSVPDLLDPALIAERIADAYDRDVAPGRLSAEREEYLSRHSFRNYAIELLRILAVAGVGHSRHVKH